ncbi:MAG: 3-deoxy-manno-octulosonate cytidylyltransferase [Elusimicrobiota bacterium]|jgi:3-deoxy-manno-octulosonate cytidylyltransferase (CMP-KDO synthetase)|nr:3-deoxy-manno-octulosonate cytidylyltransferase [Elusimicrobiota bacterium]
MKTAIIIPARYGSSRFPGKPLFTIKDKPLIEYVCQKAKESANADFIAVATDDERIYETVKKFGANVFMTPSSCKSGTDRLAFLAENTLKDYGIFINIQGDEPLIDIKMIDRLIEELKKDGGLNFATAAYPLKSIDDINNPNITKVIFGADGYALYFSRLPIPYNRNGIEVDYFKHIGVYGYKRDFLINYAKMPEGSLEKAESLEQLRALENGHKVKVIIAEKDSIGVDVPSDISKIERFL